MEQEVMQAIRAELESNIDAKYREFHSSLVPGQNCRILGVRIPVSRRIAKATARDHYEVYTESFNRFLIISLDVLICRYSPLLRAFPALFISEEPHKSFYYPSCFHSQK